MTELSEQKAKEARRIYNRQYYKENRDRIRKQQQEWRSDNPDKVKEYNQRFWSKKADEYANDNS